MGRMTRRFVAPTGLAAAVLAFASGGPSAAPDPASSGPQPEFVQRTVPESFLPPSGRERLVALDLAELRAALDTPRPILTLPRVAGQLERFEIEESPILPPGLARRFPEIRTFRGRGLDDPAATMRCSLTPRGFHALILGSGGSGRPEAIEPGPPEAPSLYRVSEPADPPPGALSCGLSGGAPGRPAGAADVLDPHAAVPPIAAAGPGPTYGETLRVYRFAVATTGEYSVAYGGRTLGGTLAAVTTLVNAVDAILEREAAIRLVLLENATDLFFLDGATDGYTHGDRFVLYQENGPKLAALLPSSSYDLGHVLDGSYLTLSWSVWGAASCCACDAYKGYGATVFTTAPPDFSWSALFLSHEIAHQLTASHTFNATTGICAGQRADFTAYEPGAGATIMGYGSNCGAEGYSGWGAYFHTANLEQIASRVAGSPAGCGFDEPTGNHAPVIEAPAPVTIPARTPFVLEASGSDPDGDPLLWAWEQFDLGTPSPPDTDDGTRPIFRSFPPSSSPARSFPRMEDVLARGPTPGESMPITSRTLHFRVTARDGRPAGGGVATAATEVTVDPGSGPFLVTEPSSGARWFGTTPQRVAWDVAGTDGPPIDCASVRITLSTDGGATFPHVLAESTLNDGEAWVTPPQARTLDARVRVEAVDGVFFDVSHPDFMLVPGCVDGGTPHAAEPEICPNGLDDDCDGSTDAADADCGPLPLGPPQESVLTTCGPPPSFAWQGGFLQSSFRLVVSGSEDLGKPRWRSQSVTGESFTPDPTQWRTILRLVKVATTDATVHWAAEGYKNQTRLTGPASPLVIRALAAPAPVAPADGTAVLEGELPTFTGSVAECTARLRLEFSDVSNFPRGRTVRQELGSAASWNPDASGWAKIRRKLAPPTIYWRLVATDLIGREAASPARHFVLAGILPER